MGVGGNELTRGGQSHAFHRGDVGQLHPRLEKLANHVTPAARRGNWPGN